MKTISSLVVRATLGLSLPATLLATGCLSAAVAQTPAPAVPLAPIVTLVGTVSARMSIGGDSTGWALTTFAGGHARRIEVSFAPSCGGHPEDGAVIEATGHYGTRTFVERGTISIFVITSFRPFAGNSDTPAQNPAGTR